MLAITADLLLHRCTSTQHFVNFPGNQSHSLSEVEKSMFDTVRTYSTVLVPNQILRAENKSMSMFGFVHHCKDVWLVVHYCLCMRI